MCVKSGGVPGAFAIVMLLLVSTAASSRSVTLRRSAIIGVFSRGKDSFSLNRRSLLLKNKASITLRPSLLQLTGGASDDKESVEQHDNTALVDDENPSQTNTSDTKVVTNVEESNVHLQPQKTPERRHASFVISSISDDGLKDEYYELRKLMTTRAKEFLVEDGYSSSQQQHPKKLLHYIASRIPAIKHSPDSSLKITFCTEDDAGAAAFCIGTVARVCELQQQQSEGVRNAENSKGDNVASDIISDRRFEQLVECVLCGVNVNKRKRQEAEMLKQKEESDKTKKKHAKDDADDKTDTGRDAEDEDDNDNEFGKEDAQEDQGISVRDACRAAWGLALLCGNHVETIGGERTMDLLLALSLRTRELLLARLAYLEGKKDSAPKTRLEFQRESKLLARDAACAMWTFACVDACTRLKAYPLFQACCSILCQSPQTKDNEGLSDVNFDVEDVVDRLAKSEEEVPGEMKTREDETQSSTTDALLDWLSPNEVTDVLWALALHGSAEDTSSMKEGKISSATASVMQEVAFDRLVAWLRHDLAVITAKKAEVRVVQNSAAASIDNELVLEVDHQKVMGSSDSVATTTVEVVDAATLLATAEDAPTTKVAATTAEHMNLSNGVENAQVEEVQVVDADALLASSESGVTSIETEIVVAPKASTITVETHDSVPADTEIEIDGNLVVDMETSVANDTEISEPHPPTQSDELFFSPHDLCSIAWAVTELRDPLRFLIVDLVTQIFASMGPASTQDLLGFDTANLVWAISKCPKVGEAKVEDVPPPITVAQWLAECSLIRLGLQDVDGIEDVFWESVPRVMEVFQPPELSRLMWSMATAVNTHSGIPYTESKRRGGNAMSKLALVALCAAHSNLSMFATEDLARIAWAFLELCDPSQFSSRTFAAEALGRILATIEASLLRWESGACISASLEEKLKSNESIRYATFFGRPRLSRFIRPLLEQRVGEYEDEEEEGQTFSLTETTGRPLLRDLTIDPSTLCKAASGFCRLAKDHRDIEGAWTLVRVAVRLLTSKSGQLLKQCTIHDIIRLCNACATIQVRGEEREFIMRVLSRRVVQILNESFEEQRKTNATTASLLAHASPWELSLLYWSLGELGVRIVPTDENVHSAHRRLHLIFDKPLLSSDQLQSLSFSSLSKLLGAVVSTHAIPHQKLFIQNILSTMLSKATSISTGQDICDITESVAKVRRAIGQLDQKTSKDTATGSENDGPAVDEKVVSVKNGAEASPATSEDTILDNLVGKENSTTIDKEAVSLCNELLSVVADDAIRRVPRLSADDIRRLLLVYSVLPFQVDELVDEIDTEIARRLGALELAASMSDGGSVQELVRQAADNAVEAGNALSKLESAARDDSSLATIKNGIKSLFSSSDKSDETNIPEDEESATDQLGELSDLANRAAASACEAAARVERVERGTIANAEATLRGVEEGAAFELGRCKELVASYRRIDFSSGSRRSRYDKERRKDIGKRVLSRLFP